MFGTPAATMRPSASTVPPTKGLSLAGKRVAKAGLPVPVTLTAWIVAPAASRDEKPIVPCGWDWSVSRSTCLPSIAVAMSEPRAVIVTLWRTPFSVMPVSGTRLSSVSLTPELLPPG